MTAHTEAGPSGIPTALTGRRGADAAAYEADPLGYLARAAQRHGDLFHFAAAQLYVGSPELVHTVLTRTGRQVHAGHDPLNGFRKVSEEHTARWLEGRRAGTPGLGASPEGERRMTEQLRADLAGLTGVVDVPAVAAGICSRSALAHCFAGAVPPEVQRGVARSAETFTEVMDAPVPLPAWLPGTAARRARAAARDLAAALDGYLAAQGGCPARAADPDLPATLAAYGFTDPVQARATLQVILAGTHVVPGAALCWLVAELAARPEVAERIRAAADDTYATAVAQEVLRLYPPVWLGAREVAAPFELGGHTLTAGQSLAFSPYLLQRDPRWWRKPEAFRPERWLDAAEGGPTTRHAYLPFGSGARICPGYRLGLRQLTLAARLLAGLHTLTVERADLTPTFESVLTPTELLVRFTPR
ncbi:cytochrome P450 [Kitasatospora sp. NPDC002227]|uniref:cytochrome P450 n=1 Tax=Kitasatospora sp. NPDC002227 TaxID=3154773 RepID=UPI00332B4542